MQQSNCTQVLSLCNCIEKSTKVLKNKLMSNIIIIMNYSKLLIQPLMNTLHIYQHSLLRFKHQTHHKLQTSYSSRCFFNNSFLFNVRMYSSVLFSFKSAISSCNFFFRCSNSVSFLVNSANSSTETSIFWIMDKVVHQTAPNRQGKKRFRELARSSTPIVQCTWLCIVFPFSATLTFQTPKQCLLRSPWRKHCKIHASKKKTNLNA